jgi:hypothetical protein
MFLGMSTLREIEAAIELLPVPELAEFARWIEGRPCPDSDEIRRITRVATP